jgi:hypothetical protein
MSIIGWDYVGNYDGNERRASVLCQAKPFPRSCKRRLKPLLAEIDALLRQSTHISSRVKTVLVIREKPSASRVPPSRWVVAEAMYRLRFVTLAKASRSLTLKENAGPGGGRRARHAGTSWATTGKVRDSVGDGGNYRFDDSVCAAHAGVGVGVTFSWRRSFAGGAHRHHISQESEIQNLF